MLVEVRQALFGYELRPVVQADRIDLHAGRCLGIFGPNGIGKTTLVRGIPDTESPDGPPAPPARTVSRRVRAGMMHAVQSRSNLGGPAHEENT